MKKYILGAVFSLALLASPAFTHAAGFTACVVTTTYSTGLNNCQVQAMLNFISEIAPGALDNAQMATLNAALTGSASATNTSNLSSAQSTDANTLSATFTINGATDNLTVNNNSTVSSSWSSSANATSWSARYDAYTTPGSATACANLKTNATWVWADGSAGGSLTGQPIGSGWAGCTLEIRYSAYNATGSVTKTVKMAVATTNTTVVAPTAAPIANFTINDSHNPTVSYNSTVSSSWDSTNGTSWSARYDSYTTPGSATACANIKTNAVWTWADGSAGGSLTGQPMGSSAGSVWAGCTIKIRYIVSGPGGTTPVDSNKNQVIMTVPALTTSTGTNGSCAASHTPTASSCVTGTPASGTEYSDQWQWWCSGSNGGINVLCSEMKTVSASVPTARFAINGSTKTNNAITINNNMNADVAWSSTPGSSSSISASATYSAVSTAGTGNTCAHTTTGPTAWGPVNTPTGSNTSLNGNYSGPMGTTWAGCTITYTYTVTGTSSGSSGITSASDTVIVTVPALPNAPTANFTVNGSSGNVTVNNNVNVNVVWSSTNGQSAVATYSAAGSTCAHTTGTTSWGPVSNTPLGSNYSGPMGTTWAGCTLTYTYTVTGASSTNPAVSTVTVTVPPATWVYNVSNETTSCTDTDTSTGVNLGGGVACTVGATPQQRTTCLSGGIVSVYYLCSKTFYCTTGTYTCQIPGTVALNSAGGASQTASAFDAFNSATNNGVAQSTTGFSYTFTLDLYRGQSGNEVSALQQALKAEGLFAGDISGDFYDQTREAVMAFQQKYGISPSGYVGSATRTKLNALY